MGIRKNLIQAVPYLISPEATRKTPGNHPDADSSEEKSWGLRSLLDSQKRYRRKESAVTPKSFLDAKISGRNLFSVKIYR